MKRSEEKEKFQQFPPSEINLTFLQTVKLNECLGGSINLKMRLLPSWSVIIFQTAFRITNFPST